MDPGPISFILLSPVYFTRTVYFFAYYYCFSLDTLIPLFQANRWDWQPHRKLGAKYLVVLCAGSTLLLAKQSLDEAPYKLSRAVAKLAGITFLSLAFSWIRLNIGFLLRENSLLYSSNLPLGVSNWTVIYTITHRHNNHLQTQYNECSLKFWLAKGACLWTTHPFKAHATPVNFLIMYCFGLKKVCYCFGKPVYLDPPLLFTILTWGVSHNCRKTILSYFLVDAFSQESCVRG
jgi:hypothetical protein